MGIEQVMKIGRFFVLFVMCLLIYARFIEPNIVLVSHVELASGKLSKNFPGLRIAFISDIHMKSVGSLEKRVIRRVNSLKPDVIVITGDMCYSREFFNLDKARVIEPVLNQMKNFINSLHSRYGVYMCRGNNDISDDKELSNYFVAAMEQAGVKMLCDRFEKIKMGADNIYLLGVDFPDLFEEESNNFSVRVENTNHALVSGVSKDNSYSHYYDVTSDWRDYQFTGRMRKSGAVNGSIGFVFYSQFNKGYDWYYRFRGSDLAPFHLSPHATQITGGQDKTDIIPQMNVWYQFKAQVQTCTDRTVMRVKVWNESEKEPANWQCDAWDSSSTRLLSGIPGVWSSRGGLHWYDDLCVTSLVTGDTLLFQDFEDTPADGNPFGWVSYNFSAEAMPIMKKYIPDSCYTILLAHTPDFIMDAMRAHIDLQLSGHTHGGQIRLPFIGALWNMSAIGTNYAKGLMRLHNTYLYVNRGIGTIMLPMRFLCPPEITEIQIKSGN
jgi:predicted MPP superfamily phosphohydrolase